MGDANTELVLGIDGGSSKTRALLADRAGRLLGSGTAGPANQQSVGFAAATRAILDAVAAAFHSAACAPIPVAAACLGLAGADRPAERAAFAAWAMQQAIARRCCVANDAELVLAAGTPAGWGVALICGTGSFCYGRAPDGRSARAGGWGYLLGDEGSGYDIAIQALRLAAQTADGRAEAHALLRAVLDHWGLAEPADLIGRVYGPAMTRAAIAALARTIVALAEAGDPWAAGILNHAAAELARLVTTVARRLDLRQPPLALGGGLFGASPSLRQELAARTPIALGPVTYAEDPAQGAVELARRLLVDPQQEGAGTDG